MLISWKAKQSEFFQWYSKCSHPTSLPYQLPYPFTLVWNNKNTQNIYKRRFDRCCCLPLLGRVEMDWGKKLFQWKSFFPVPKLIMKFWGRLSSAHAQQNINLTSKTEKNRKNFSTILFQILKFFFYMMMPHRPREN